MVRWLVDRHRRKRRRSDERRELAVHPRPASLFGNRATVAAGLGNLSHGLRPNSGFGGPHGGPNLNRRGGLRSLLRKRLLGLSLGLEQSVVSFGGGARTGESGRV